MSNYVWLLIFSCIFIVRPVSADDSIVIIKVNGAYGIISKGANQGIEQGQLLFVKRLADRELRQIAAVKVIRTTSNRAAVEMVYASGNNTIKKGDFLFFEKEKRRKIFAQKSTQPVVQRAKRTAASESDSTPVSKQSSSRKRVDQKPDVNGAGEITSADKPSNRNNNLEAGYSPGKYRTLQFRNPWISFNSGVIIPNGEFAVFYSPSMKIGARYMVPAGQTFNLGIEVNHTFVNGSSFDGSNLTEFSSESSSLFEAFVVFQRFFGNHFFLETGGGLYRPKLTTMNLDNVKSTFTSSYFGLFGGAGVFIPTSPYAGLMLKGRVHNYFDDVQKKYFGVTGGFRFKIQ